MKHDIFDEFYTADLLLRSRAETRAVDAFTISWVKLEKQLRRLTTNLIFQHSAFEDGDPAQKEKLKKAILNKRTANHDKFIYAIYQLSGLTVKEIIGDQYRPLKKDIDKAYKYRQKIFHGQQTGNSLTRLELEESIRSIRNWCEVLANGSSEQIGYDGFSRNSLRKNARSNIDASVDDALKGGWREFVKSI